MINVQPDRYSCGPVAVYNLLNKLGYGDTYEEVENYMIRNGYYRPKYGTRNYGMDKALKDTVDYRWTYANLKDLDIALEYGPAILFYRHEKCWHYVMVERKTPKNYIIYNVWSRKSKIRTKLISRKFLAKWMRSNARWYNYAEMWVAREAF